MGAVTLANLADIDFLPGLLLGSLPAFHHLATHSLFAAALVVFAIGGVARWSGSPRMRCVLWGGVIYFSHIGTDMLVDDPTPPFGVQLFWPLSSRHFSAPITPCGDIEAIDTIDCDSQKRAHGIERAFADFSPKRNR